MVACCGGCGERGNFGEEILGGNFFTENQNFTGDVPVELGVSGGVLWRGWGGRRGKFGEFFFPKTKISRVAYRWRSELVVTCCGGGEDGVGDIWGKKLT